MDEDAQVPVFTSMSDIEFPLKERTARQVVTLYNPYKYIIQYKVLCTAPSNYAVGEANGLLNAKSCKDIVVRCTSKLPVGCVDKLRIEIRKRGESQLLGSRDLLLRTVDERSPASLASDRSSFHGLPEITRSRNNSDRRCDWGSGYESSMLYYVVIGVFCAVALALPTVGDPSANNSHMPSYLHLTLPQKLVAAFILGVITTLILRPS